MIRIYNTKMMDSGSEVPGKGTYAYDKIVIDELKEDSPEPAGGLISGVTENVITYFEIDHAAETDNPSESKQIIYNHDYVLEVDPAKDDLIRKSKELMDASIRASVVNGGQTDDSSEPLDPATPVTPGTK